MADAGVGFNAASRRECFYESRWADCTPRLCDTGTERLGVLARGTLGVDSAGISFAVAVARRSAFEESGLTWFASGLLVNINFDDLARWTVNWFVGDTGVSFDGLSRLASFEESVPTGLALRLGSDVANSVGILARRALSVSVARGAPCSYFEESGRARLTTTPIFSWLRSHRTVINCANGY